MKPIVFARFLLLGAALALAALAARQAEAPVLARMGILFCVSLGALAVSIRQAPGDNWLRYTRALVVVVFVYLSGAAWPPRPAFGPVVFFGLNAALVAFGAAQLAAGLRRLSRGETATAEFQRPDVWILNFGVLLALLVAAGVLAGDFGLAGITYAAIRVLAVFGLLGLFFAASAATPTRPAVWALCLMTLAALAAALGLGGACAWQADRFIRAADEALVRGDVPGARESIRRAEEANRTFNWPGFNRRILRLHRDTWVAAGDWERALRADGESIVAEYETRVLTGDDEQQMEFLRRYVSPGPLEPIVDFYASPSQARRFARLHREMDETPGESERLHLLFLRCGRIDRLAERYATSGLPPMRDAAPFIEALDRMVAIVPDGAPRAQAYYLRGLLNRAAGRAEAARADFEATLARWPDDHNTLIQLERLAEARNDAAEAHRLRALPHRIDFARMTGKKRDFQVDDTLWTALEGRPGQWHFALDMKARPERNVWPRVSVLLARRPDPIFLGEVRSAEWRPSEFAARLEADSRTRLSIVFENDLYVERPGGAPALNRNLYFRSMRIERR